METGVVEVAGATLAWTAEGSGTPLVIVHDIAGDAEQWAPELAGLAGRTITYDRRGYGASSAPDPYTATTVEEQSEDLVTLLRARTDAPSSRGTTTAVAIDDDAAGHAGPLGSGPATLLGAGFGALVALDVAKRHPGLAGRLVLVDPPLFQFVPTATEAMARTRGMLEDALREGGTDAAIASWLQGEDPVRVARAQRSAAGFFADYAGLASWPVTRRELRAITIPAVILTRPGAPEHVRAAADALAALLPGGRRVLDGDPLALGELR